MPQPTTPPASQRQGPPKVRLSTHAIRCLFCLGDGDYSIAEHVGHNHTRPRFAQLRPVPNACLWSGQPLTLVLREPDSGILFRRGEGSLLSQFGQKNCANKSTGPTPRPPCPPWYQPDRCCLVQDDRGPALLWIRDYCASRPGSAHCQSGVWVSLCSRVANL